MKKLDFTSRNALLAVANDLILQGNSVIPVQGDKNRLNPKKPAVAWKDYQCRVATSAEIDDWFTDNSPAIGIVCGQISQLMVIDFDDEYTFQAFIRKFPHYSDTYTVRTRRGYHLYYQVSHSVLTHKFDGGDIKGEKSYVIAPPSRIARFCYRVINRNSRIHLSPRQTDEILNYFHVQTDNTSLHTLQVHQNHRPDLVKIYETLVKQLGRNNALYRVASIARSYNIAQNITENALIRHHITQPAPIDHPLETPDQRYTEAIRTIESAYSTASVSYSSWQGLPNSIRETLLKIQNSTLMPRILDVMQLVGWKAGLYFSMSELIDIAQRYGLNRKSVMSVLTGRLSVVNGQYVIGRQYVEYPDIWGLNSSRGGRPIEIMYQVPSVEQLLNLLDVKRSPSDLIMPVDVKSAHLYRLALHREYIKRVSPEVPMWWLAERIGVNVRTIQRYNVELNVQKTQNFAYFTLSKSNLDSLPKRTSKITKNATNGFWLETDDGCRFPAWRHIGSRLLKTRQSAVKLVVQKPAKLSLRPSKNSEPDVVWHSIAPSQFVQLQAFRLCTDEKPRLKQVVDNLFQYVKQRTKRVRYYQMQLHFDSVIAHIAKDDVAETITSYLFAYDQEGDVVKRPARRGIAFRMLKEFGNGNVYLALMDTHTEMFFALARHALRFGQLSTAMKFLLSALEEFPLKTPQFAG